MPTRRDFMAGGSVAVAASLAPLPLTALAARVRRPLIQLFPGVPLQYTRLMAENLVNSRFNILYEEAHLIEAELVEVRDGTPRPDVEEFSMIFRSTWEPRLEEGMRIMEHPSFVQFPLYLAPVEGDGTAYFYEAAVSRLLTTQ